MEETTQGFESGVVVTCVEDKYIGVLLDIDDNYLYLKATHKMEEVWPKATEESVVGVAAIYMKMTLWDLRMRVAWKFKVIPLGMSKEKMARMLAEEMVDSIIEENGPVETYVALPHAVKTALSHMEVLSFESLTDVKTSVILDGLDFPVGSAYNEEHGDSEDVPREGS